MSEYGDEIRQVRAEEGRKIECHCPCGCTLEELDEFGYCDHLIGFTNKAVDKASGKFVLEPVQARTRFNKDEQKWLPDGYYITNGREPELVQDSDVLVNPTFRQLDKGVYHDAQKWVSFRVYNPKPEERVAQRIEPPAKAPKRKSMLPPNKKRSVRATMKVEEKEKAGAV